MSQLAALGLALFCVCLTAAAQVLMKMGMSAPQMQQALVAGPGTVMRAALISPWIWAGMSCFGASAALWLLVLGKLDVSTAYPITSVGIVLTLLAGIFFLGESFSIGKLAGVAFIVAGVLLISASR